MLTKRVRNRRPGGSLLAEFAFVLVIAFFMMFPLINLVAFGAGVATLCFTAHQAATAASQQSNFSGALAATKERTKSIIDSGLAQWVPLKPVGGLDGCGVDLYVVVTNYNTRNTSVCGPNTPVPGPIDPSSNVYEFQSVAQFQVGPFLNLSGFPFIGNVPIVGKAAQVRFAGNSVVEHPEGMEGPGHLASLFGNSPPQQGAPIGGPVGGSGGPAAGWNNPSGYTFYSFFPDKDPRAGGYLMQITMTPDGVQAPPGKTSYNARATGIYLAPSATGSLYLQDLFGIPGAKGGGQAYAPDPKREIHVNWGVYRTPGSGASAQAPGNWVYADPDETSPVFLDGLQRLNDWMAVNRL